MRYITSSVSILVIGLVALCLLALPARSQTPSPSSATGAQTIPQGFNQAPVAPPASPVDTAANGKLPQSGTITINGVNYYLTTKTQYEFWLAWMTVALGAMAMLLLCILFYPHLETKTDDFVKLFAFVIVVFSAMFLIAVGYNDTQTAPVYSLLGTIIGYLFGREFNGRQNRSPTDETDGQATERKPDAARP